MRKSLVQMSQVIVIFLVAICCLCFIPFGFSGNNVAKAEDSTVYTISYYDYVDGQEIALTDEEINGNPRYYTEADLPLILSAPTARAGYSFKGWHKIFEESRLNYVIDAGTTGNIALYVDYEVDSYKINYLGLPDGIKPTPSTYTYEEAIDFSTIVPEIYGCRFEGWFSDESLTIPAQNIPVHSTGEVTVYAKYSEIKCNITFDEQFDSMVVSFGQNAYGLGGVLEGKTPKRDGYTFAGWYTSNDFARSHYVGTHYNFTNDVTLYAKWDKQASPIIEWIAYGCGIVTIIGFVLWLIFARPKIKD